MFHEKQMPPKKRGKDAKRSDASATEAAVIAVPEKRPPPPQLKPWKPGQSGNPAGRPVSSRNKLAEAFIKDVYEVWATQGREAVEKVVAERPHEFLKVVAGLLPREIKIKDELSEFSDEQLAALNALAVALIGDAEGNLAEDQAGAGAKALN